jgi:hypothetical protein
LSNLRKHDQISWFSWKVGSESLNMRRVVEKENIGGEQGALLVGKLDHGDRGMIDLKGFAKVQKGIARRYNIPRLKGVHRKWCI